MIGIGDHGAAANAYSYNNNNSVYLYYNNTIYPGGGSPSISGSWSNGTVIGLAWDTDIGDIWFSVENDWGSRDPNDSNTGTSGVDYYSWGYGNFTTNYVANGKVGMCFVCTNGSSGGNWKGIIQRGSTLKYAPPTGFTSQ